MKVGFFGNSNNYPFLLARAFRRLGHEVLFIVDKKTPLDRPESRYNDITIPYPEWIYDASPLHLDNSQPRGRVKKIVRLLRGCDAVILNQWGISLLPYIRRPAIAILTGSDLDIYSRYDYADFRTRLQYGKPSFLRPLRLKEYVTCKLSFLKKIYALRAGIRKATAVSFFAKGLLPDSDVLLSEIGVWDQQRIFLLMTDLEKIKLHPVPHNPKVRIFNVARLTWEKPPPPAKVSELDYKGSDIMIRGMGLFWRTSGIPLDIRLVKKGNHVAETMQLIEDEGISGQVTWCEEMSQMEVFEEYRQADIVFDQLGKGMIGMGTLDAMATGRPVIANGRPEILEKVIGVTSPVCQAATPEEVCVQLQRLVPDHVERERVGLASRKYVEECFSFERAAQICIERLTNTRNHNIPS